MNFMSRLLCAFSLFLSISAFASGDQSAAHLRKRLDAMNTLQGSFTQTLFDEKGTKLEESKGTFALQRPGKFYWRTESPFPQLLVSNQKTIWLYDPDLETVNERPFSDDLQQTPALLLSEDVEKLRKNFTVSRKAPDAKTEQFNLTPKVTDGLFQQLTLTFVAGELTKFRIQDSLGQTSHFALQQVERNQAIAADLFNFTPPPGVEILRD